MKSAPAAATVLTLAILAALSRSEIGYAQTISAAEAKNHIGETTTVCGVVASATYSSKSKRQPTFLNPDVPYPNHIFTGLIWGSDRSKFGSPEVTYRGKNVCISGQITEYKGKPEIVISAPGQIRLK